MTAEPPDSPAHLPAPYRNPWGLLGADLRAVVADLGLQLRALWRRNRQGELSVPGFWPARLQALFWPLLLALLLALPWIGWRLLTTGPGPAPVGPAPAGPTPASSPAAGAAAQPLTASGSPKREPQVSATASAPGSDPTTAPPLNLAPLNLESRNLESRNLETRNPAPLEPVPPPELALDPLLQLLAEADPQQLIVSAHPEPAQSLLRLTLAPAWGDLAPTSRLVWADRWSEQAQQLGYGRFELVDGQRRLLGRRALVGSGMILLDPTPKL